MRHRPHSQLQTHSQSKTQRFNTKGYFYMVEPYCQQYLKAKHAAYEKSKKLRQSKNEGKQNNPTMFQFNQPKAGFYELKGCKVSKLSEPKSKQKSVQKKNAKPEYFAYFLKKYAERKQKIEQKQNPNIILPAFKLTQPSTQSQTQAGVESNYCKSIGLSIYEMAEQSKIEHRKLRTEPLIEKKKNNSCEYLNRNHKASNISNLSINTFFV